MEDETCWNCNKIWFRKDGVISCRKWHELGFTVIDMDDGQGCNEWEPEENGKDNL